MKCGYCRNQGHNKKTCPEYKQRIDEIEKINPHHPLVSKRNRKVERHCSFCGSAEHIVTKCKRLSLISSYFSNEIKQRHKLLSEGLRIFGIGRGTIFLSNPPGTVKENNQVLYLDCFTPSTSSFYNFSHYKNILGCFYTYVRSSSKTDRRMSSPVYKPFLNETVRLIPEGGFSVSTTYVENEIRKIYVLPSTSTSHLSLLPLSEVDSTKEKPMEGMLKIGYGRNRRWNQRSINDLFEILQSTYGAELCNYYQMHDEFIKECLSFCKQWVDTNSYKDYIPVFKDNFQSIAEELKNKAGIKVTKEHIENMNDFWRSLYTHVKVKYVFLQTGVKDVSKNY